MVINNYLQQHQNKLETRENKFQSSSISFHQYFQVIHIDFKLYFWHLVLLAMISFKKMFKTVAQKFALWC